MSVSKVFPELKEISIINRGDSSLPANYLSFQSAMTVSRYCFAIMSGDVQIIDIDAKNNQEYVL